MNAPPFICFFLSNAKTEYCGQPCLLFNESKIKHRAGDARTKEWKRRPCWKFHAKTTGGLTTLYAAVKGWRSFLAQNLSTVPCFRGVKSASRESHERGCRSHRAASETVLFVGGEWVGVVALRYNDRPKTVGAWLITWWTFWCSFIPPVLIFYF